MTEPVRILHIFGRMSSGGAQAMIMNIYRCLNRQHVQFDFAVHTQELSHYDEEIIALGGRVFILADPKKIGIQSYSKLFCGLLEKEGPFQAVHSHLLYFSGILMKLSKKKNIRIRISHSHSIGDGKRETFYRALYRKYMSQLIKKNSTLMLGCSNSACEYLYGKNYLKDDRVHIITNAIDLNLYKQIPKDKMIFRKELGFSINAFLIGNISRFVRSKNHLFLIQIFIELIKKRPEVELVLVGEGDFKSEIIQAVAKHNLMDKVHFLGSRKDIPDILNVLDVFVFPSLYEGLGMVVIEAQAANLKSFISDTLPYELDLDLGLVDYISLNASAREWADYIMDHMDTETNDWSIREFALRKAGYDINDTMHLIKRLYGYAG